MIERIFNGENPFWKMMGRLFDLLALNALWLVCCIPVFTVGPATAALYYALFRRNENEDSYAIQDFFTALRRKFGRGVLLGLPLTLAGAFLLFDLYLCWRAGGAFTVFLVLFAVVFLLWAAVTLYAFPLLAQEDRRLTEIVGLAFTLSVRRLVLTLIMLAMTAFGLAICLFFPVLLFVMFALIARFCTALLAVVFRTELGDRESGGEEAP